MLIGLYETAPLLDAQFDVELALVVNRHQEVVRLVNRHATHRHDIGRRDRARLRYLDHEHRLGNILVQTEDERFEVLNDLVNVLDHPLNGLMLMHHAVDPKRPNRGSRKGR